MNKTFILYVPGSSLNDFHRLSPWIELPLTFSNLKYRSILICGHFAIPSVRGLEVIETMSRGRGILRSIFEPFLAFQKITVEEPDIVMISPFGSYLLTIIPLIVLSRLFIKKCRRTKFILKTDWSLDFFGFSKLEIFLSRVLLIASSFIFNEVVVETYCGVRKARGIPLIRTDRIQRFPIAFPNDFMLVN